MNSTRRWIGLTVLAVGLCGCAATPSFVKPQASVEEQYRETLACQREADEGSWTIFPGYRNQWLANRLLRECFERHGWTPERD
jgi:hypothetical protein